MTLPKPERQRRNIDPYTRKPERSIIDRFLLPAGEKYAALDVSYVHDGSRKVYRSYITPVIALPNDPQSSGPLEVMEIVHLRRSEPAGRFSEKALAAYADTSRATLLDLIEQVPAARALFAPLLDAETTPTNRQGEPLPEVHVGDRLYADFGDGRTDPPEASGTVTVVDGMRVTLDSGRVLDLTETIDVQVEAARPEGYPFDADPWPAATEEQQMTVYRLPDGRECLVSFGGGSLTGFRPQRAGGRVLVGLLRPDGSEEDVSNIEWREESPSDLTPVRVLPPVVEDGEDLGRCASGCVCTPEERAAQGEDPAGAITYLSDGKYAHLACPQCTCGERFFSGFTIRALAEHKAQQHLAERHQRALDVYALSQQETVLL